MNVSLTPELEKFIADQVESGQYPTTGEVVRDALRLLEEQGRSREERLAEFNRELDRRIAAADRGETVPAEEVWERLRKRSEKFRKLRA